MEVYDAGGRDHTDLVVSAGPTQPFKEVYLLSEAETLQCSYLESRPDVAVDLDKHVCPADLAVYLLALLLTSQTGTVVSYLNDNPETAYYLARSAGGGEIEFDGKRVKYYAQSVASQVYATQAAASEAANGGHQEPSKHGKRQLRSKQQSRMKAQAAANAAATQMQSLIEALNKVQEIVGDNPASLYDAYFALEDGSQQNANTRRMMTEFSASVFPTQTESPESKDATSSDFEDLGAGITQFVAVE
jgi:hypothetical protein